MAQIRLRLAALSLSRGTTKRNVSIPMHAHRSSRSLMFLHRQCAIDMEGADEQHVLYTLYPAAMRLAVHEPSTVIGGVFGR